MNESGLQDLTLASWAASVWEREVRGVPMQLHEAALAFCMRQHMEWRQHWDNLVTRNADSPKLGTILIHIYNDAAVQLQVNTGDPPEIRELYSSMRSRGFSEIDALHQIAFVLEEITWKSKSSGEPFDMGLYVEKAKSYVQAVLLQPKLARTSRQNLRALRLVP